MVRFIFIIPLTPISFRNDLRNYLWTLCQRALQNQTNPNWLALVIGENHNTPLNDPRFVPIMFEGGKKEKLKKATEYIINESIKGDYIIRLDDDDIINPNILEEATHKKFDVLVDKYQWFWHFDSGRFSHQVWYWFPNTCIHKREHALAIWGNTSTTELNSSKKKSLLIEADHDQMHNYYKNKNILCAPRKNPIYIRTINDSSITARNAEDYKKYILRFGVWNKTKPKIFTLIPVENINKPNLIPEISIGTKLKDLIQTMRFSRAYKKIMK